LGTGRFLLAVIPNTDTYCCAAVASRRWQGDWGGGEVKLRVLGMWGRWQVTR